MTNLPYDSYDSYDYLKLLLSTKLLRIIFTKKDGTDRDMLCTLREDILREHLPEYDETKIIETQERMIATGTIPVWDIEKEAWRSFRLDSIISIELAESNTKESETWKTV